MFIFVLAAAVVSIFVFSCYFLFCCILVKFGKSRVENVKKQTCSDRGCDDEKGRKRQIVKEGGRDRLRRGRNRGIEWFEQIAEGREREKGTDRQTERQIDRDRERDKQIRSSNGDIKWHG